MALLTPLLACSLVPEAMRSTRTTRCRENLQRGVRLICFFSTTQDVDLAFESAGRDIRRRVGRLLYHGIGYEPPNHQDFDGIVDSQARDQGVAEDCECLPYRQGHESR